MSGKSNGSGNGHDPKHEEEDKILHFPSLAERKKKLEWRMQGAGAHAKGPVPFFNFKHIPRFTRSIIFVFIAVQLVLTFAPRDLAEQIIFTFGFVPGYFTGVIKPFPYGAFLSPVTYIFIHGGWMHIAFNAVMAVSLGVFFEREFGTKKTIVFFFFSGLCGVLFYFILNPFSTSPMIGASGSVSGLFGALIMLMGKRGGLGHKTRNPWPLIAFWIVFMIVAGVISGANTAWQTHIGGFLGGIGLLYLLQTGKLKI
jgi:membrane associated rhomboid family serine protease